MMVVFPAPVGPTSAASLSGLDREADVVENRRSPVVTEIDVLELDLRP